MRVVFCGNPAFALPTLEALFVSRHEVVAVVCSPDRPRGRGKKVAPLPVKARALERNLPVLQPENLKHEAFLKEIGLLKPDCLVVVAFRILPRELFALPRLGSLNVHPSLLPRGRGPAPIRWTLLRGETLTGVSIIQLSEEIDGGGILKQVSTEVAPDENYGSLHDRLARLGAMMLMETLDALESGIPIHPIVQDETLVTKAPKLKPADYKLDWTLSAEELLRKIRAFSPEPGASTCWGGQRMKILAATLDTTCESLKPGEIRLSNGGLVVGTGNGELRLNRVKPEGKRAMTVEEFLRGRPTIPASFSEND